MTEQELVKSIAYQFALYKHGGSEETLYSHWIADGEIEAWEIIKKIRDAGYIQPAAKPELKVLSDEGISQVLNNRYDTWEVMAKWVAQAQLASDAEQMAGILAEKDKEIAESKEQIIQLTNEVADLQIDKDFIPTLEKKISEQAKREVAREIFEEIYNAMKMWSNQPLYNDEFMQEWQAMKTKWEGK